MSKVPPVECHSCGYPIGEIYPIIQELKKEYMSEKLGKVPPAMNPFIGKKDVDMSEIYDNLLLNPCCRVKIVAHVLPQDMVYEQK